MEPLKYFLSIMTSLSHPQGWRELILMNFNSLKKLESKEKIIWYEINDEISFICLSAFFMN